MRRLVPAILLRQSCTGLAFGQQGHSSGSWSLGGFGSILYPGTGHAPAATPPIGQFASNGFRAGSRARARIASSARRRGDCAVSGLLRRLLWRSYAILPLLRQRIRARLWPRICRRRFASGPGLPSVVINQNFVPPQANPQVRDYTGDQPQHARSIRPEAVSGAAFASLCRCAAAQRAAERPAHHLPDRPSRPHHRAGAGILDGRQHVALCERRAHAESAEYRPGGSRSLAAFERRARAWISACRQRANAVLVHE